VIGLPYSAHAERRIGSGEVASGQRHRFQTHCADACLGSHSTAHRRFADPEGRRHGQIMETGVLPSGSPSRPPMPSYRLSHSDAAAVAAYLKSVGAKGK
jgi:hypothetical protein